MAVKLGDLEYAMEFVSVDMFDNEAYVCRATGRTYWISEDEGVLDEDAPADLTSNTDRYVPVPTKRDLDLGTRLVYRFAEEIVPWHYDDIRDIFRRKGAYRRFKQYLISQKMLDTWYDFQAKATRQALIQWCRDSELLFNPSERE